MSSLLNFSMDRRLTPTPLRVLVGLAYLDLMRRGGYHIRNALDRLKERGFGGKIIDVDGSSEDKRASEWRVFLSRLVVDTNAMLVVYSVETAIATIFGWISQ
jgi:hypothetical protein